MLTRAGTVVGLAGSGRSRRLFWIGLYALILAAWVVLFRMTASPLPGVSAAEYWATLCVSAEGADPLTLYGMWVVMTAAMMLPSFVPALRVFGEISAVRASDSRSLAALVAGYATVWLAFSAMATALQVELYRLGALSSMGEALSPWATVVLMAAAGGYQFSHVRQACLARCRHPLVFFMEHWRPGLPAAFATGARLGVFCVGCCWVLMLLGFVGGAMSLMWMGVATLLMTFEKLPEIGRFVTKPLGLLLFLGAATQAAQTLNLI